MAVLVALGAALAAAPAGTTQSKPPLADLHAGNLLTNPGFEAGFRAHGAPELVVGDGWTPWYDARYVRPEFKDEPHVRLGTDGQPLSFSLRVFHGATVQKFFTFSAVHDAGFYQQASVEPGTALRFAVYARVWSSDCDDPCVSPLAPCPGSANSHGSYRVQVGIDPTGTLPVSLGSPPPSTVRWSSPIVYEAYDRWYRLSVDASAESDRVTVYARGSPVWPVKHNDSYWDDGRLEAIVPAPGTATSVATGDPATPGASATPAATPGPPTTPGAPAARAYLPACAASEIVPAPGTRAGRTRGSAPLRPADPVPPGADIRIEYPIRAWPGQENFAQPTCDELDFESVLVHNNGAVPVQMAGWVLRGRSATSYVFPPLDLRPGDRARVWTKAGDDVSDGRFADLYWHRDAPVWHNESDEAVLYDDNGVEVARRGYP